MGETTNAHSEDERNTSWVPECIKYWIKRS